MIIPIGVIIRRCSIFLILVEVSHNPLNRIDIETFVVYWPFDNFCLLCSTKVVSMECTAQSHRNTASVGPSSLTMPLQRRTFFLFLFLLVIFTRRLIYIFVQSAMLGEFRHIPMLMDELNPFPFVTFSSKLFQKS